MTENHTVLANALRSAQESSRLDDEHVEDALRLVLAFMRIRDVTSRRSLIHIVESMAEDAAPLAKRGL